MIDLEDTSDFDSGSDVESSEDIEIDGKVNPTGGHLDRPVSALQVLKNVNKAYYNRPSI